MPFKHPSTFDTLAMDPDLKDDIKEDLLEFTQGREFYQKAGKPWKRGYLLYGPPGTGKSSMIAAIANFLKYDIYDVELTEVSSNSELRKLLIQTTNRSVIVIEDIDCSVDLAERAKARKDASNKEGNKQEGGGGPGRGKMDQDEVSNYHTDCSLISVKDFPREKKTRLASLHTLFKHCRSNFLQFILHAFS